MRKNYTLTRRDLFAITLFFGFSSAIIQVILIRELLTIFRGNEFIIGIIFSAWFLGIFLGARFNPMAAVESLQRRIASSLFLFPIVFLILIYFAHFLPIIFPVITGTFYSINTEFLFSVLFTMPVSVFVGYVFPPIVSLASSIDKEKSGGNIYYIETLGSFMGGIIFTFILIDLFNPLGTIAILILISLLLYIRLFSKNRRLIILLIFPLCLFVLSERIEKRVFEYIWNQTHTGKIIEYKRTRYQTIVIEAGDEQTNIYGDGIYYHTMPDRFDSRGVFHLIQSLRHKSNERILLFGMSPGSLLYNLLKTDLAAIYYFEIDQDMWELESRYRKLYYETIENDNRLRIIQDDFRHFLSQSNEKFDIIICLPPPPVNAMLNRFYTREFFSMCKDHVEKDGIFITSIHGFSNYMSSTLKRYVASIYKSFKGNFPHHLFTSGETIFLLGSAEAGVIPESFDDLINDYKNRFSHLIKSNLEKEIVENFDPEELRMFFEQTQLEYFKENIGEALSYIDENIDLKPKAYWNKTVLSAYQEKSILYNVFSEYHLLPVIVILLTLIVFTDVKRTYSKEQYLSGLIIFTIGFVSISTVILLVILYQNFYGIVYYRISLINALYMLGLASGSYVANKNTIKSLSSVFVLLVGVFFIIILYTFINLEFIFWIVIFIFSFLCGTVFPSLFLSVSKKSYHATASLLDSLDHFGSIMGSLISAMFLIPMLGIINTIIVNIAMLAVAIIISRYLKNQFSV